MMVLAAAACAPGVGDEFEASACAARAPAEGPGRLVPAPPGRVRVQTSGYGPEQRDGLVAPDGTVILPMIYDSLAPTSDPDLFRATCRTDPDDASPGDGFVTAAGVEVVPPLFGTAYLREGGGFEVTRWVGAWFWERHQSLELDEDGRVTKDAP